MKNKVKKLIQFLLCLLPVIVAFVFLCGDENKQSLGVFSSYEATLDLYYDDYLDESYYTEFEIIDLGKPDSFRVGYGVPADTPDKAVVSDEDGVLHATGTGEALVSFDGKVYKITVNPAPISLFLMIGQSNMYGNEGSKGGSVVNKNGTAYSTFGISSTLTCENAEQFVPSSLSGEKSRVSYVGTKQLLNQSPVNSLTRSGDGKIGLDGAFAERWHSLTGDKVWLVNAAHTGTSIKKWIKGAKEYNEAVALFKTVQKVMKQELAAGHYVLKDYGYFWFQGCSDRGNTASSYVEDFLTMHKDLKKDLLFDFDGDGQDEVLGFCNVIMPRAGKADCVAYRTGVYEESCDAEYYQSFYDLEMRAQRVALYWLVNNPELKDINLVCNIGDQWVTMPDGSDGVEDYFNEKYKNGRVNYVTQKPQDEKWRHPATPEDVHDNVHYNQVGYNEIGFESALNSAYILGRIPKPQNVKTTVNFYDWTGYRKVSQIKASMYNDSSTLVVPVVNPVYESKSVSYSVSDNLSYVYYDLKASSGTQGGELTSTGADEKSAVKVIGKTEKQKGKNAFCWIGTSDGLKQKTDAPYVSNKLIAQTNERDNPSDSMKQNMFYRIKDGVTLDSDRKWMVEWTVSFNEKTKGDTCFVLFSKNSKNNESDQYISLNYYYSEKKVKLIFGNSDASEAVFDVTKAVSNPFEKHTYSLYNRIFSDGRNVIKLNIDQNKVCDIVGLSDIDFCFNYIGAERNRINNCNVERISVYEDCYCDIIGHTYTLEINEGKAAKNGKYTYRCVCGYFYITDEKQDVI